MRSALPRLGIVCFIHLVSAYAARCDDASNAETKFRQARAYLRGNGVPVDVTKAFHLMKEAAAEGHPEALGGLGYFYAAGIVVPKDEIQAAAWFRKGAEKGAAKAQLNLGKIIAEGRGVPKDEDEGRKWIERAAAQQLPEAVYAVGQMHFFGQYGVPVDHRAAFPHFRKAAEEGNAGAQNIVGVMFRDGLGMANNPGEAERWFRNAAEQNDPKAQSNLAHLLGVEEKNDERRREALTWLILAAEQSEATAARTWDEIVPALSAEDIAEARKRAAEFKARVETRQRTK